MLMDKDLHIKTFDERIKEAIMQIPLYTEEWTNFNPSDPGMTILENLTAFTTLQQEEILKITPEIRRKLLLLLGFTEKKGRCARVLMKPEGISKPLQIAANTRFALGDLIFETNKKIQCCGSSLIGLYAWDGERSKDFSYLLGQDVPKAAVIFGKTPKEGDQVYFVADKLPEPGEEVIFYLTMANRFNRNPVEEKGNNALAAMVWECYTENGFEPMNVVDNTSCMLLSGEVRLRLPHEKAALYEELPTKGYCIRARLLKADYDVSPKLIKIDAFLFESWQKETKSVCFTYPKCSRITLNKEILEEEYILVFAKEEKGSYYRKYAETTEPSTKGRFYTVAVEEDGSKSICFDKRKFGFAPDRLKNAVKIMTYTEELMRQYYLGEVYGYDHQEIKLPVQYIVPESFSIIAKRVREDGEEIYDFVRPNHFEEDSLSYYLMENDGKIIIEDAGAFIGATLYMGGCSVTRGPEGNIRPGNHFRAKGELSVVDFVNAGPGTGGCFRESIAEVKQRFLEDLNKPYVAVTGKDYETLVRNAPGLCIHKVKATLDEAGNQVEIAVMPGTDEEFPVLSETYRRILEALLEKNRLLTTRLNLVSPVYSAIQVKGVVYVKRHYQPEQGLLEQVIRQQLNYLDTDKSFGEPLRYDEVFYALEGLDCVEYVADLALFPENPGEVRVKENDIYPPSNGLCYAGEISLEIRSYEK